jgi:hypothetical protein
MLPILSVETPRCCSWQLLGVSLRGFASSASHAAEHAEVLASENQSAHVSPLPSVSRQQDGAQTAMWDRLQIQVQLGL